MMWVIRNQRIIRCQTPAKPIAAWDQHAAPYWYYVGRRHGLLLGFLAALLLAAALSILAR